MMILETLRDALQGLVPFVETKDKIKMANALMEVNFDILDVGSFVSPRAVPQMSDTAQILDSLDMGKSDSAIFVLAVNPKGGQMAAAYDQVSIIGFPYSTSPEFLKRNINANLKEARERVYDLQNICVKAGKQLMIYFSMAFGNPYGDDENLDLICRDVKLFSDWGIRMISLSDITGVGDQQKVDWIYKQLSDRYPEVKSGLHLHVKDEQWVKKVETAWEDGCRIFDGVISGLGGCPMTGYELLGNLPTANLLSFAQNKKIPLKLDESKFREAMLIVNRTMAKYLSQGA